MTQTSRPGIKSEHGEGDMETVETIDTCLRVRRSARGHAVVTIRTLLFSAVSLLVTTGVSSASDPNIISGMHGGDSATIISELPPDHPVGTKATVALVSFKRALHLDEPFLSTFIVDYLPGGSAVLHRSPTAGYVLVHVLSGTIRAQAWEAGMGTYRSGQTWVEPAVGNDITTKNASAVEPARALVVLMTNETSSLKSEDH
jgi:quercetin dioxygenase-like cupin family protein